MIFPFLFADAYAGLVLAVIVNSIGGGIIEVLISPIAEAAPSKEKAKAMSMLHSFYCFGHMGVVLISSLVSTVSGFFTEYGIKVGLFAAIIFPLAMLLIRLNMGKIKE